jgi:SPP1 gp7 family putative phage head morphogenesis protein
MGAPAEAPSPDFSEIFSVNDLRRAEGLPAVSWGNVPAKSVKSIYANKGKAKGRTPPASKRATNETFGLLTRDDILKRLDLGDGRLVDPPVAKFDDRGREFELTFVSILEGIARALKDTNEAAIIEAIREGLQRIRENYGNDAIMTVGAAQVARMTAPLLDGDLAQAYAAIRIQAALATMRIASRAVPGIGVGVSLDDVAPAYRAGIEWMLSRDIMTKTDVEDMVRAVSLISDGLNAAAAERTIREQVFALANARTEELTAQMTRLITGAVERGDTVGSFLQAMDDVLERGELPAMTDAYLETVFRTETANIYQRQRLASMNDPMVAGEIWGVELFAIDDERSRPTHAATDGLMLKKGSAAFNAWLPGPPYSYNCRCTSAPVMMGEADEEAPGALEIVQAIERFAEGDGCGCGSAHESFTETETPRPRGGVIQTIRRAFRL